MKTYKKIACLSLLLMACISCTQEKETHDAGTDMPPRAVGDSCTYDSSQFRATVVSVSLDTLVRFQGSAGSSYRVTMVNSKGDTLLLNQMSPKDINKKFLDEHNLKPGTVLEGTVRHIKSGSCTPVLYRFRDDYLNF